MGRRGAPRAGGEAADDLYTDWLLIVVLCTTAATAMHEQTDNLSWNGNEW